MLSSVKNTSLKYSLPINKDINKGKESTELNLGFVKLEDKQSNLHPNVIRFSQKIKDLGLNSEDIKFNELENLKSEKVVALIDKGLTFQQALHLNTYQRENIEAEVVQKGIKNGEFSVEEVLNFPSYHYITLENNPMPDPSAAGAYTF